VYYVDEGLSMANFVKLSEYHLKQLGFRMGERVILVDWTSTLETQHADVQPVMHCAS